MTYFSVPYGKGEIRFQINGDDRIDQLEPEPTEPLVNPAEAIRSALEHPLYRQTLPAFTATSSVGIAINDKTRPVPQPNPVPVLLEHLENIGVKPDNITIFIGSGTHAPMEGDELHRLLNEQVISRYRVIIHDCDQSALIDLGKTRYKTPIQINADFYHCDLKISVGNIEPHHFMGFSGGVKTAVIGLAGRETINANHAMLTVPQARSGVYRINPMRQDIEEIGHKVRIDYSLGTILDETKQIIKVFYGHPDEVMQKAIPYVRQIFGVTVEKPYDMVIASPGGSPKDINLYQSQKALTHAAHLTRDGGYVLLLAACPEGSGSLAYENYVKEARSHEAIIQHFSEGYFEVGPHKAFQIAREATRVNLILVSDIAADTVKQWKLIPCPPKLLNPLINWVIDRLPKEARIAILPAATRTMPGVQHDN